MWHHHAHHRGEFRIGIAAGGGFVFRRRDGLVLPAHIDPSGLLPNAPEPGQVPTPCWTGTGERLDRHWAIAVLAQRRDNDAERRQREQDTGDDTGPWNRDADDDAERQDEEPRLAS